MAILDGILGRLRTTPYAHSWLETVSVRNTHSSSLLFFAETILLLLTEMWRVAGSWALKRRQLGWCAPSSAFVVPAVAWISCAALIPPACIAPADALISLRRSDRLLLRAAPARRARSATAGTTSPPTRAAAAPGSGRLPCTTRHSWSEKPGLRLKAGFDC